MEAHRDPGLEARLTSLLGLRRRLLRRTMSETESVEDMKRGYFRVIELNGARRSHKNIYDPRNRIGEAIAAFRQWDRLEIGPE